MNAERSIVTKETVANLVCANELRPVEQKLRTLVPTWNIYRLASIIR